MKMNIIGAGTWGTILRFLFKRKKKVLVVSTGRSGSGYLSKLLTLNGIECGHEISFNPDTHGPIEHPYRADSSWLATPYIKENLHNTLILHVVRNPIKVVESYVSRGFFDNRKTCTYYNFLQKHLPEISNIQNPIHASIYHVVEWSKLNKQALGSRYYKIENDLTIFLKDLGITNPKLLPNTKYNTNDSNKKNFVLDLNHISKKYLQMLKLHGEEYGYKI